MKNRGWLEDARAELAQVSTSLEDPSVDGVSGCVPHLERAISVLRERLAAKPDAIAAKDVQQMKLDELKSELATASRLFENAYALQAGWAILQGLPLHGEPANGLYGQAGKWVATAPGGGQESWQG